MNNCTCKTCGAQLPFSMICDYCGNNYAPEMKIDSYRNAEGKIIRPKAIPFGNFTNSPRKPIGY